jgi:hypothetical protein
LFCFAEVNATAETNTLLEDECLTSYHHPGMTFTIGYTTQRKIKQKHNTICDGHHYEQTNTNNLNKI